MRMKTAAAASIAAIIAVAGPRAAEPAGSAAGARRPKKLIETGWDIPDGRRLAENRAVLETRPFDGVVVGVAGEEAPGKSRDVGAAFGRGKWERAWFARAAGELKAARSPRLAETSSLAGKEGAAPPPATGSAVDRSSLELFVLLGANPGDVDWFDDAGWADIAGHWRIAAWLVREAGLAGILFDPEPYTPPHAQFSYRAQPDRGRRSFAEYRERARRRGREVMEAIAAECPGLTLFAYFMDSACAEATGGPDPAAVLEGHGYGLYPAFIDGWLDAAPPSLRFVDGCEGAYRFNSVLEYLEAGQRIRGDCQELVSPENRAKYRAQVGVSFGIYLDAYWNPPDSPWYIDGLGGRRVDRLRENVRTALRVADEYVWVYGERFRWWPTGSGNVRKESWPEAIPGCDASLALARDPAGFARARIEAAAAAGGPANLLANAGFDAERVDAGGGRTEAWAEGRPPAGWSSWQAEGSKGTFGWDRAADRRGDSAAAAGGPRPRGAARAAGVANGCFLQARDAKPGEAYAVGAWIRVEGQARAWVRVRWQTAGGAWTAEALDRILTAPAPAATGGWSQATGIVTVPPGAGKILILLGVVDGDGPADTARFDDVALVRVE